MTIQQSNLDENAVARGSVLLLPIRDV